MEVKKAIFLDKDGTLIPNIPYNVNPDFIELNEGVLEGLSLLQHRYVFILVSNQAGVAKGYFTKDALVAVEAKLASLLAKAGIQLSGFYYCVHDADNPNCLCRKPKPGLLLKAASEHGIDLTQSWMIGDILHDVEAGKRAGCRSILLDVGNETEWNIQGNLNRIPNFIANNFVAASQYIIKEDLKRVNHEKQLSQFI